MLRLLVLDDETLIGLGIAEILRTAGFEVLASVETVTAAVGRARLDPPDVIVSDVMLQGRPSGLDLPEKLIAAGITSVPIVYLSSYDSPYFVDRAREAGAAGYLAKTVPLASLVRAIEGAAAGQTTFAAHGPSERQPSTEELRIMSLLAAGFSSGEIALRMGCTEKAIDRRLARLYERYRARSRVHLSVLALDRGWTSRAQVDEASGSVLAPVEAPGHDGPSD
jgi:DNA-binding NarL/FixJ family response regulator